jgi:hypothetical protein
MSSVFSISRTHELTAVATTSMIPAKFLFAISGMIDLNIATFLFTKPSLVSPDFCPAPADMTTIAASAYHYCFFLN